MKNKTKIQLIAELEELQKQNAELEAEKTVLMKEKDTLRESEKNYRKIFNNAGVSYGEYDFTNTLLIADKLKAKGITDFRSYFEDNPKIANEIISSIKLTYINDTTLNLYSARTKDELLASLSKKESPESNKTFLDATISYLEGNKYFECEAVNQTPDGRFFNVLVRINFSFKRRDGHKALVTVIDITDRKKAEEALRESESKYRTLVENADDFIYLIDKEYKILSINTAAARIFEKEPEEVVGKSISEIFPEELAESYLKNLKKVFESGEGMSSETELVSGSKEFYVSAHLKPIKSENGQITSILGISRDITEHKKVEEDIRRSKLLLESSIESPKDMIILSLDREYRYLFFNKTHTESMSHVYGTHPQVGDCIFDHMKSKDDIEKVKAHYDRAMAGEGHVAIDEYGDEQVRYYYEVRYNPICDEKNEIIGVTVFAQNITDHKQAEEVLRDHEEKLRQIIDLVPHHIYARDSKGRFILANKTSADSFNMKVEDMIGVHIEKLLSKKEDIEKVLIIDREVLKRNNPISFQNIQSDGKGGKQIFDVTKIPFSVTGTKEPAVLGIGIDITEKKRIEEELRESEERYRQLHESITDGVFVLDRKLRYVMVNDVASEFLNIPQNKLIGNRITDSFKGIEFTDIYKTYKKVLKNRKPETVINKFIHKDGTDGWYEVSVYPSPEGILCIAKDITERKKAEKVLQFYREMIKNMTDGVYLVGVDDVIIKYTNRKFEEMFGYNTGEMLGHHASIVNTPTDKDPLERATEIMTVIRETGKWHGEVNNIKKDGTPFWCYANVSVFEHPLHGKVLMAVHTDISEHKKAEEQIKYSLKEKELLLQEIHHRVKNNLQIISSLLALKSEDIKDKKVAELLFDCRNTIGTMVKIHERLYQSENLANINFKDYIYEIANDLVLVYYPDNKDKVLINYNVGNIFLGINTAIPFGMVLNELISNSLKHAFPGTRKGQINIDIRRVNNNYECIVMDNGIGISKDFDVAKIKTIGLYMATGIIEKQLCGKIDFIRSSGTIVKIAFPQRS